MNAEMLRGGGKFDGHLALAVCEAIVAANHQLLSALAASARTNSSTFPLAEELRAPMATLSHEALRGAASCGVLLADAGFADPARWRAFAHLSDHDGFSNEGREWLAREDAVMLAHSVLMAAWYLVHTTPEAAGILLGMTDAVVEDYRSVGLGYLSLIATHRPHCIRPRWQDRATVWRDVLATEGALEDALPSVSLRCLSVSAASSAHLQASLRARHR